MGGVGLCSGLHIVGLKVVDVDTLVVEHTIESVYSKLLIDTVDGGLDVFLTLIEVVFVDGTERCLFQVSATCEKKTPSNSPKGESGYQINGDFDDVLFHI